MWWTEKVGQKRLTHSKLDSHFHRNTLLSSSVMGIWREANGVVKRMFRVQDISEF